MKIYWTIRSIPELKDLPAGERNARWNRVASRVRWAPVNWLAMILCAVLAAVIALVGARFGWGAWGALLGGGMGGFAYSQILIAHYRRHYRDVLLGQDDEADSDDVSAD